MRMRALLWMTAAVVTAMVSVSIVGCPADDECPLRVFESLDVECHASKDCAEAGLADLECVDGACRRTCVRDVDCTLTPVSEDAPRVCQDAAREDPVGICEAQLCVAGCQDAGDCAADECCVAGRCALYHEGFESTTACPSSRDPSKQTLDFVTLEGLDWNGPELGRTLRNPNNRVVRTGAAGCTLGDDLCAGPAAEGTTFVVVGREVIQRVPVLGTTCRACACCLECILSAEHGTAPTIPSCPGEAASFSIDGVCSSDPPEVCQSMCNACDQCPEGCQGAGCPSTCGDGVCGADETCESCPSDCDVCPTARLAACEVLPAKRTCSSCKALAAETEACLLAHSADDCTCAGAFAPASCKDCLVCKNASDCRGTDSEFTPECQADIRDCDALDWDGCFSAPRRYPADLTDDEQSIESRPIDLAEVSGALVLQFDAVAFDIGDTYVISASSPSHEGCVSETVEERTVTRCKEEVLVQLCAANCADPASWVDATFADDGEAARLPPARMRNNGISSLGGQGLFDWRLGRFEFAVPNDFHTSSFRFRLVPRLADGKLLGVDNVSIVRRSP